MIKVNDVFTVGVMPSGDTSYCNKVWIARRSNGQYTIAELVVDMGTYKSRWCANRRLVAIHTEVVNTALAASLLNNQQKRKAILMRRYVL